MQKKIIASIVGIVFLSCLTLYFLVLGSSTISDRVGLVSQGVNVTGTVVNVDGNDESYFPTISYKTQDGQNLQFTSKVNSTYVLKEEVPVVYNRSNPRNAKINNFGTLWVAPVFQVVAFVLFAIATLVPIRSLRRNRWWLRHSQIMARPGDVKEIKEPAYTVYHLFSNWTDPETNRTYSFDSGELDFDPRNASISQVAVDIDPTNPANYYIDKRLFKQARNKMAKVVPTK